MLRGTVVFTYLWEGHWTDEEICHTDKGFGLKRDDAIRATCLNTSVAALD